MYIQQYNKYINGCRKEVEVIQTSTIRKQISKFTLWITLIAIISLYISSIFWWKIGMSESPVFLGYIGINSTINTSLPYINDGDLIIAKTYDYGKKASEHDVIIHKTNDGIQSVSLIRNVFIDDNGNTMYNVITRDDRKEITVSHRDVIGKFLFVVEGFGDIYMKLISPSNLLIIPTILIVFYLVIKSRNKKRNHLQIAVDNEAKKVVEEANSVEGANQLEEIESIVDFSNIKKDISTEGQKEDNSDIKDNECLEIKESYTEHLVTDTEILKFISSKANTTSCNENTKTNNSNKITETENVNDTQLVFNSIEGGISSNNSNLTDTSKNSNNKKKNNEKKKKSKKNKKNKKNKNKKNKK